MKKHTLVVGLLGLALCALPSAWAEENHEHKEGEAKIPTTVGGIWAEVKEHEEMLAKTIADKKLDKVHEMAFEIRDLVAALPDKSKDLPAEKLAKVKANAKFVADLAKRLDESGDANDQAATEANFKKLQGILKSIESLYPPDALKHAVNGGHKHNAVADHEHGEQAYACPIHREVTSDKAGKCLKCNMQLEQVHADHSPKHGGIFAMVNDYHLELVEKGGELRLYLYDAFTKPLSVAGLNGTVKLEELGDKSPTLTLAPSSDNAYLAARVPPGIEPEQPTVEVNYKGERLFITLPLRITLQGRIVDVACFARDGEAALQRDHDECARACIASGSPVGFLTGNDEHSPLYLVTLKGDKFASKAANEKLLALANKEVQVTGRIIQCDHIRILELAEVHPISDALQER